MVPLARLIIYGGRLVSIKAVSDKLSPIDIAIKFLAHNCLRITGWNVVVGSRVDE